MNFRSQIYVATVIAGGVLSAASGIRYWRTEDPLLFLAILILGILGSFLKATIPGIPGTMSMNFIFVMLAVTRLSLGETIAAGVAATLVQTFWHRKKQNDLIVAAFNVSIIAAVIGISHAIFHAAWFQGLSLPYIVQLWFVAGVYFLLNTAAVAGIIAVTSGQGVWKTWRESYGWSYAYYWLGASAVAIFNALERAFGLEMALIALPIVFIGYRSYRMRIDSLEKSRQYAEEQRRHADEVATLHLRTIRALALAIEAKDTTTAQHLHRVQTYALGIGRELALKEEELLALSTASILHDIGKIAVPECIISKPGKLSREEFEKMKIHPVVGGEIAESVKFPYPVAPIVSAHHEKWDGTGYPYGLKAEEIPIGARILSAVDCLDALASDRQYRRAMPLDKAMEFVRSESGKAFDPQVVEILSRRHQELEALARATLTEDNLRLSINVKIERGAAPDAGLEVGRLNNLGAKDQPRNVLDGLADSLKELQCLDGLDRVLARRKGVARLLELSMAQLGQAIPFDSAAFFLRDGEWLLPHFASGTEGDAILAWRVQVGTGLCGWVAEHRIPLLNGNPAAESGWKGAPPPGFSLRSALAVPLETEKGVFGVLALYSEQRDAFHGGHLRLCTGLGSRLALALESALVIDAERAAAGCYPGCDLANTGALLQHLERLLAEPGGGNGPLVFAMRFRDTPGNPVLDCVRTFVESGGGAGFLARVAERDLVAVFADGGQGPLTVELGLANALRCAGFDPRIDNMIAVGSAQSPMDGSDGECLLSVAASRFHPCRVAGIQEPLAASAALLALNGATSGRHRRQQSGPEPIDELLSPIGVQQSNHVRDARPPH